MVELHSQPNMSCNSGAVDKKLFWKSLLPKFNYHCTRVTVPSSAAHNLAERVRVQGS